MASPAQQAAQVERVACVGTGVVGAAWVADMLAAGLDVAAWDPSPGAPELVERTLERAWPVLERRGLAPGARRDRLRLASSLEDAVADAEHVQESGPERLAVKRAVLRDVLAAAPGGALVASSTSRYPPAELTAELADGADRVLVVHPLNPVYLVPLVEVVGGASWAADRTAALMERLGHAVVRPKKAREWFVANYLQNALGAAAHDLVRAGVADFRDVDRAVTEGLGLRWAAIGPFLTAHLAGGPGGIEATLEQFHLNPDGADPELDAAWAARLIAEVPELADGLDHERLAELRDRRLAALRDALDRAAGHAGRRTDAGGQGRPDS